MGQSLATSATAFADIDARSVARWRIPAGLAALLLWACWTSKVDLRLLFSRQTWAALSDLLQRLFPPDLSLSFLKVALHATLTTAATAVIATAISSILALPLGILASGRLWRTGISRSGSHRTGYWMAPVSWIVLHGMGLVRSVPDLVWALLFVAGLGLGPTAGTLALAVSYTGLMCGRLRPCRGWGQRACRYFSSVFFPRAGRCSRPTPSTRLSAASARRQSLALSAPAA
jgi:ABC-type phosphate/phosphonate transport system permease subunit